MKNGLFLGLWSFTPDEHIESMHKKLEQKEVFIHVLPGYMISLRCWARLGVGDSQCKARATMEKHSIPCGLGYMIQYTWLCDRQLILIKRFTVILWHIHMWNMSKAMHLAYGLLPVKSWMRFIRSRELLTIHWKIKESFNAIYHLLIYKVLQINICIVAIELMPN